MGINWNNVIQNQARGMDPFSAYQKEEERLRRQNAEEYRRIAEKNRPRYKSCKVKKLERDEKE